MSSRSKAPDRTERSRRTFTTRALAGFGAILLGAGLLPATVASAAPVGQGFNLNASDLRFIYRQIQIAQNHAATATTASRCQTQVGNGPNQIPPDQQGRELPWGLRTVDGSCNNLVDLPGRETWGAADTVFPRLVPAAPRGAYAAGGNVTDVGPRTVSNLVVDQSPNNPAAVAAAGTATPAPGDGNTLFIENVATDVGLSAPFNSWFTLFGQFFDHGLDLVSKGGNGTVVMPLAADDPLVIGGRDGNPATTGDNVAAGTPMLLTRTTDVADPGNQARNTTTSYVDQNQTYTSHPSHQVFLREFEPSANGPVETGKLLEGPGGGLATWTDIRAQARTVLGIELSDQDVLNVPLLMTDAYGHFERGPNGFPLMVTPGQPGDVREGNLTTPITTAGATRTGHAFLDDIAHHAVPVNQAGAPLAPDGDAGTTDDNNASTYDDEMLGAHFVAGDGRANENIGLTSVHHVFHSEHNRLADDIDQLIHDPATGLSAAEIAGWESVDTASGWAYGERLFQAARFVTEMEYQHLVFEEFGRKVQPMINLFGEAGTGYNTTVNATIRAEFAHAVYRFGHSMLTETVARRTPTGGNRDIPLLDAFLNPPSFLAGGLTADQAAGEIVRGMTRQPGNEIDEFVTGALRNNLLGLPLDLASINMARARDTGIPTLNEARRAFFDASSNSQLRPYESWADLAFSLRHPESLQNFIAAFGTHPSITGGLQARRDAAALLVYGNAGPDGVLGDNTATPDADESQDDLTGTQPADAFDFLNSIGAYAQQTNGRTVTGVDDIDLWVGGLAEKPMVFGGLLGPTFNFVFEQQMEDLQDGDRFYYLSRTAGLNLLTQLEGNSFAELIQRNTDAEGLPADSFSFPALVFNINPDGTVADNPETPDIVEPSLITTMANGTLRYGGPEHVVFNGRDDAGDRIWSSEGDDTIRGNGGDDWMEGGDGVDNLIGGLGDDLMTDLNGDDTLKGGDGDDTMSSGPGFGGDLNQGGRGNDLIFGGNDTTETFGGPGNDFVYAGDAEDTVFGDDGDDWIETGRGPFALAQGDNGAPFADDPNEPGHDVLDGDGGEQDYDAEGGDDIMLAGPGIQRSEGMRGFDWVAHQGDPQAADSDMDFTRATLPAVENNRDRFDEVEALSGYGFDDVLRGDDRGVAELTAGANEPADSHVLNQAGIARITGLDTVLRPGTTRFDAGNIILGGGGSDTIEGRGGDDVIDGDAQLTVELRVPYRDGTVRTVTSLGAIRADALAGRIDPGGITIIRRIERPAAGGAVDTAVFSGPEAEYTVTTNPDGTVTVAHTGGTGQDGTDTLRGIEELQFADTGNATVPGAPTNVTAAAGNGQATVSFTAPADGGSPIVEFEVDAITGGAVFSTAEITAPATSGVVSGLANGTSYTFVVRAVNAVGAGPDSAASAAVTPQAPNAPPTVTARVPGVNATGVAVANNITATFNEAVTGVSGTTFTLRNTATNALVNAAVSYNATTRVATLNPAANLAAGTQYTATLTGGATAIRDVAGAPLATTTWSFTTAAAANPAPTVTTRTPAAGATGVLVGNNIDATFSEPVQGVSNTTFVIRSNAAPGTAIAATVTRDGTTNRWILNPTANLAAGTAYTVTLTGGATAIRDLANAPLATTTWSFTTGAAPNAAPTVTTRTPAVNATTVAVANNITATFSEAVNGVSGTTFTLRNTATNTLVTAVVSYNTTTRVATLNPSANLAGDTRYTATLTGGTTAIRDTAGAPLVTTSWSFLTGPAPTVTARTPAVGATGVGRLANVTATFSEPVQAVSGTTVRLTRVSTGAVVTAVVSYNATTRVVTLNPSVTLAANAQFRVNLTGGATGIRDAAGNPLANVTWTFTTGG